MISFERGPWEPTALFTVYRKPADHRQPAKRIVLCGACIESDATGELHKRNVMRARPVDGHACRRCARVEVRK